MPGDTTTTAPVVPHRPAMLTSCIVNGKSTVFYVDKDDWIKIRTNPQTADVEPNAKNFPRTAWPENPITVKTADGKLQAIKSLSKDMAAVSYPLSGKTISRLYFIDDKQILQELQKDGDADWSFGDLGKLKVMARKGSPITCLLSLDAQVVKVFYYAEKNGNKDALPSVAWWTGSAWTADTIF